MSQSDFWSRRRAAVEAEEAAEALALARQQEEETESELEARDDGEILKDLGLPEPEALETPDAVREFMGSAVPQRLKTRALRRLWRLNPTLANLDGLVDYGEDFTDAATVVENLQTAYQVGKGMLAHLEAMAAAEDKPEPEPEVEDIEPELPDEPEVDVEPQIATEAVEVVDVAEVFDELPVRRRMQFSFEPPDPRGAA